MLSPEQVSELEDRLRKERLDTVLVEELLDHYCCLVEEALRQGHPWESAYQSAWQQLLRDNDLHLLAHQVQRARRPSPNWKRWGLSGAALMLIIAFFSFNLSVRAAQRPTLLPVPAHYTEGYDWQQEAQTLHIRTHPHLTPVRVGGAGQVLEVYRQAGTRTVVVWHNDKYQSIYRNLSEVCVYEGQELEKGKPIGYAREQSVQYQVRKSGQFIDPTRLFSPKPD